MPKRRQAGQVQSQGAGPRGATGSNLQEAGWAEVDHDGRKRAAGWTARDSCRTLRRVARQQRRMRPPWRLSLLTGRALGLARWQSCGMEKERQRRQHVGGGGGAGTSASAVRSAALPRADRPPGPRAPAGAGQREQDSWGQAVQRATSNCACALGPSSGGAA